MTTEDAIRFLDHQASLCRGRDACEALCLLLPAMMRIMGLERMEDVEALAFRYGFKRDLEGLAAGRQALPAQDMRTGPRHEKTQKLPGGRGHAHVAERPATGCPA